MIIHASQPNFRTDSTRWHRVVLRRLDEEKYVTHIQLDSPDSNEFIHGHYFDGPNAFEQASNDYFKRAAALN